MTRARTIRHHETSSGGLLIAQGQGGTGRMQEPQLGWITDLNEVCRRG